ncbi:hypothetical protein C1645_820030 [Glomus cerebriforme]|uniref:Crinkler effector protein N-terminal domain-containing protein n=1 Tax=Glomus cerebriforme TaxID=658196 RepID=A0A397T6K9_9GLOM|nr:hypothetical protein C1645_820030 [Glomus cerebriforme]
MSDSASSSTINIKTEIVHLVENQGEKAELLSYFTKHKDQQDDALSDFICFDMNESKLAYLRNFLKPEQLVTDFVLTRDALEQIKFIYEHKKEEFETSSLLTINSDKFQQFLMHTQLTLRSVDFSRKSKGNDIPPYKWTNLAENHKKQRKNVINYFNQHLKPHLSADISIEDVVNNKEFLNTCKGMALPFSVYGGIDIVLVEKKMIVADIYVNKDIKVFGVLTDLNEFWDIFWLDRSKEIIIISITNCKTAMEVIGKMVKSSKPKIFGMLIVDRMKFIDLCKNFDDPNDDIALLKNFYDEMEDDERITGLVHLVFTPSSQFRCPNFVVVKKERSQRVKDLQTYWQEVIEEQSCETDDEKENLEPSSIKRPRSITTHICLVQGNLSTNAFLINISKDQLIGHLKKTIKIKRQNDFAGDQNELLPTKKILKYFFGTPAKEYIHIIVSPNDADTDSPSTGQKRDKAVFRKVIDDSFHVASAHENLIARNVMPFTIIIKTFLLTRSRMLLSSANEPVLQAIVKSLLPLRYRVSELSLLKYVSLVGLMGNQKNTGVNELEERTQKR